MWWENKTILVNAKIKILKFSDKNFSIILIFIKYICYAILIYLIIIVCFNETLYESNHTLHLTIINIMLEFNHKILDRTIFKHKQNIQQTINKIKRNVIQWYKTYIHNHESGLI